MNDERDEDQTRFSAITALPPGWRRWWVTDKPGVLYEEPLVAIVLRDDGSTYFVGVDHDGTLSGDDGDSGGVFEHVVAVAGPHQTIGAEELQRRAAKKQEAAAKRRTTITPSGRAQ